MWEPSLSEVKSLIGKGVQVRLVDATSRFGQVITVDPVSGTLVLGSVLDGRQKVELLNCEAIKNVDAVTAEEQSRGELAQIESLMASESSKSSNIDAQKQKAKVLKWFKENRIPITEDKHSNLQIFGAVTIESPYTVDCCLCSNDVVLSRVRSLLGKMPVNDE